MSVGDFNAEQVDQAVDRAVMLATQNSHEYVTLEHLMAALLDEEDVAELLSGCGVKIDDLRKDLMQHLASGVVPTSSRRPSATATLTRVIQRSVAQVLFSGRRDLMPADVVVSVLQEENSHAAYFLQKHGCDLLALKKQLSHGEEDDDIEVDTDEEGQPRESNKGELTPEKAEKVIRKFCVNLNESAGEGKIDPLIGREDEVAQLVMYTARRTKNNVVLTGEPGVGKTAIVEGLAKLINEGNVPEILKNSTVWSLDVGALLAGAKFRGDVEERMKLLLKSLEILENAPVAKPVAETEEGAEAVETEDEVEETPTARQNILFIDEIHMIMGAGNSGGGGGPDVSNLLKPALAKGKLRCIGSTTYEEFRKHFEKDRALLRRFQKLDVFEPSTADAKRILKGLKTSYEEFHGITYTDEALDAAVDLSARYITGRFLPDKAIDIIDAAGARQRVRPAEEKLVEVGLEQIEFEVSKIAKVPARTVKEDETEKLAVLDQELRGNVFGQEAAIVELTDAVYLSRSGLRDPEKPLGNYLFTGPTGVGKTEVAKTLARTLNLELVRFDMSEYMEKHTVSKLIGSPPGYVGHGEGGAGSGLLTNAVETHPHCVLLLDEIEKAHPDIFNILLQVMDHGKLTNSNGKTVDFRNVILIMTSNAGASELQKNPIGFDREDRDGEDDPVINKMFTPEFRNRLDAIVKFKKLGQESMLQVVDKFLKQTNELAAERNVVIEADTAAREWLARKGYDPKMGARPMARLIQEKVKKPLSREMLFGRLKQGGKVVVTVQGEELALV